MKQLTEEDLRVIRDFIIDNVCKNENFVFNETLENEIDIISLVCSMYNVLYNVITGNKYDYFYHWTNKIGGACDDYYIENILKGNIGSDKDV